ncbi:MAG: slipin family protein [Sporichthyaceae bacterium]
MLTRSVVRDWERAVVLRRGAVHGVLGPGRHRLRWNDEVRRMDVRERGYSLPLQEVLTADAVGLRLSVNAVWRIVDPVAYLTVADEPEARLHVALQQAVRRRVSSVTLSEALAAREALSAGLGDEVAAVVEPLGLAVLSADVRDLTLPAEIRRAVTEVLLAREQGRADLERARSEAAAFRSLANTARLLEEHPVLLHLRTLQTGPVSLVVAGPGTPPVVVAPGR